MSSCDTLARCAVELRRQRRHELADIVCALCVCVSRDNGDALLAEIRGHVFDTLQRQPEEKVACDAFGKMLEFSLRQSERKSL